MVGDTDNQTESAVGAGRELQTTASPTSSLPRTYSMTEQGFAMSSSEALSRQEEAGSILEETEKEEVGAQIDKDNSKKKDEITPKEEEEEEQKKLILMRRCLELGSGAGAVVTRAVADDEEELQQLVAHGCSLVGNLEVAAVCSTVRAQVDSEASEATWRRTLEDSAREAAATVDEVQRRWKEAVEQHAPENMAEHLRQLKAECDTLLSKKQFLVTRLRQEIEALDETLLEEMTEHRHKREELLRRLAEHTRELSDASRDTIKHLQAVTEDQRKELTQSCSELLDAALVEFNADLEELMRRELEDAELKQQDRVSAQLVPSEDGGDVLTQLEAVWQQHTTAACALRLQRCLEKPRLLYRMRLMQQLQQTSAEQLNHTRRLIIGLRPQLQLHRQKREKENREREKRRETLLLQVKQQQQHLQQLQQRCSSRREHLQRVQRGISAMHCDALASLMHQIQEVEQHIEVQVLGSDRLPGGDDAAELRTLLLQEPPFAQSAISTASSIIKGKPKEQPPLAVGDDSASVSNYQPTEVEKTFLLGMVEAAFFLTPQESNPLDAGKNTPEDDAILQLENIFREVAVNSDTDMHALLTLARGSTPATTGSFQRPLAIQQAADCYKSHASLCSDDEGFTNSEVLDILIEFTKRRRLSSARQDEHPAVSSPDDEDLGIHNDDCRWDSFLQEVCSRRERTWGIAGHTVGQYLAELQGRRRDEKTVVSLQQQVSELQRLLL
ncbi:hypothetical protein FHG87_006675 [Trinorchestia longiramus]|nr:hypothetical protein FHG87_006675 [Trinorchestia longiramus]